MHKQWQRKREVVELGSLCWECARGCHAPDTQHSPRTGRKAASLRHTQAFPRTPRAAEQEEALCSKTANSHLCWADTHAHHLQKCSASSTLSLCQLKVCHSCWWQPHSHTTTYNGGSMPQRLHAAQSGMHKVPESASCSALLFKVGPPRAIHTTSLVKFHFNKPVLDCHSHFFTLYHSSWRQPHAKGKVRRKDGSRNVDKWASQRPLWTTEPKEGHTMERRVRTGNNFSEGKNALAQ